MSICPSYAQHSTHFASLGGSVWLLVLVRAHTEVLDRFTSVPLATEEDSVGTSWCTGCKLVKGQDLTAGVEDALLRRTGKPKGSNRELRDIVETDIIGDGTDSDNDFRLAVLCVGGFLNYAGEGNGRTVDLRLEQTLQDYL